MSPLAELQAELGARLLAGDGGPYLGPEVEADLTPAERAGWPTTVALYRQWRLYRIRSLAALTLARLGEHAELAVDAYLAANPGSTSYAASDAAGFLAFAAAARPEDPYLAEISFLELALIRARRPVSGDRPPSPGYLARSARASLRTVPFPPARLMLWLTGRGERPAETPGGTPVLIAPGVTSWIRPATAAEADLWHWLAMDRPRRAASGARSAPAWTLRQAGAVLDGVAVS